MGCYTVMRHSIADSEPFRVFTHRTDQTVIGCSGFHGDCLTLTKIIDARLKVGVIPLNSALTTKSIAGKVRNYPSTQVGASKKDFRDFSRFKREQSTRKFGQVQSALV